MRPLRLAVATACLAGSLAVPAGALAADQIAGVTDDDQLVLFRSDSPGNVEFTVPVSGLPSGEKLVGLDSRPSTGALYALGRTSRVYRVDLGSGAATAVGDPFNPLLDGASFGFGTNPVADALRAVSDTRQNLRISPTTGQVVQADTPLAYAAGDPGAGVAPSVVAAGYTNRVPGASTTTLYDIDQGRDTLVTQNPPNDGTLTTVGALGVDVTGPGGFSVATSGTAYAALRRAGQANPELFTVNLATGAATSVGAIAARPANLQAGAHPVVSITALGPISDDRTAPNVVEDLSSTLLESTLLDKGLPIKVACDEACTISVEAHVDDTTTSLGTATGSVVGGPGSADVSIPLDANGKALVNRKGTLRLSVQTTVKDSAGNTRTTGRVIRTQTLAQRIGG
jgi:VCBS repeat-containing protein